VPVPRDVVPVTRDAPPARCGECPNICVTCPESGGLPERNHHGHIDTDIEV
jgi:hypothetical protein